MGKVWTKIYRHFYFRGIILNTSLTGSNLPFVHESVVTIRHAKNVIHNKAFRRYYTFCCSFTENMHSQVCVQIRFLMVNILSLAPIWPSFARKEWVLMGILLLQVFCWKRIVQKFKTEIVNSWQRILVDKNENTLTTNDYQRKVLFICWRFWMLIHMQILLLNVPYAPMKVMSVLMRVYRS